MIAVAYILAPGENAPAKAQAVAYLWSAADGYMPTRFFAADVKTAKAEALAFWQSELERVERVHGAKRKRVAGMKAAREAKASPTPDAAPDEVEEAFD